MQKKRVFRICLWSTVLLVGIILLVMLEIGLMPLYFKAYSHDSYQMDFLGIYLTTPEDIFLWYAMRYLSKHSTAMYISLFSLIIGGANLLTVLQQKVK